MLKLVQYNSGSVEQKVDFLCKLFRSVCRNTPCLGTDWDETHNKLWTNDYFFLDLVLTSSSEFVEKVNPFNHTVCLVTLPVLIIMDGLCVLVWIEGRLH